MIEYKEIVRCKDCKYGLGSEDVWCEWYDNIKSENGFCDKGERKDGERDE